MKAAGDGSSHCITAPSVSSFFSGYLLLIPCTFSQVSVGIVLHQQISNAKKAAGRDASANGSYSLRDHYLDQFQYLPGLKKLLGTATLAGGVVKSASDYSYSADRYAGNHFRIIGDASGKCYRYHCHTEMLNNANCMQRSSTHCSRKPCYRGTTFRMTLNDVTGRVFTLLFLGD